MLRAGMGVAFFAFVAFEQNAPGGTRRGGRGYPPPNQAHQAVPTSWADGWMGLGTAADAEFDTKCQLIRSVPYLIHRVGRKKEPKAAHTGIRWPAYTYI